MGSGKCQEFCGRFRVRSEFRRLEKQETKMRLLPPALTNTALWFGNGKERRSFIILMRKQTHGCA